MRLPFPLPPLGASLVLLPLLPILSNAVASTSTANNDTALVRAHVSANVNQTLRDPSGVLRFPYQVPGGPYNQEWDWDAIWIDSLPPVEAMRVPP